MSPSYIDEAKHRLGETMSVTRRQAHRAAGRDAATAVCGSFQDARSQGLIVESDWIVSGYWPVRDELDIRRLLGDLHHEGLRCALPVVTDRTRPLTFRAWRPSDVLVQGEFGLSEPPAGGRTLTPRILLVPLLAVDARGNRLGYGGGYYDRTLQDLRAAGPVTAVGIAFEAQRVSDVPRDGNDARLDWVVTEKGAYRVAA